MGIVIETMGGRCPCAGRSCVYVPCRAALTSISARFTIAGIISLPLVMSSAVNVRPVQLLGASSHARVPLEPPEERVAVAHAR
jgi:hypothetical protein